MYRWYGLALVIIVLDQVTKYLAVAGLDYNSPVPVTSFFNLTLLYNKGAAFSLLSEAGGWQRWFFAVIAVGISSVLVVWIARIPRAQVWLPCALALILGGAIGNLYDRAVLGHVVDFISLHYGGAYFPAFNIADMGITGGAIMMLIDMFRAEEDDQEGSSDLDKE